MFKSWSRAALAGVLLAAAPSLVQAQMESAQKSETSTPAPMSDIVTTAINAGSFKTLVTALKAADLMKTLEGPGPFTVFAPTDAAFAKLPKGTLRALLADHAKLVAILTYHVVPGTIMAADVVKMGSAHPVTVNGQKLDIEVRAGKVYINGAQVVQSDIKATNGVIHVIDAVLMPKG